MSEVPLVSTSLWAGFGFLTGWLRRQTPKVQLPRLDLIILANVTLARVSYVPSLESVTKRVQESIVAG